MLVLTATSLSHSQHEESIPRTTSGRFLKLLAIIIGIQVIGGVIFFANYNYWNSYLPLAGREKNFLPPNSYPTTGHKVEFILNFVMSRDLKDYAFNALSGKPDHNPDIKVKPGDTVTIHVKNNSKSFHSFGIVADPNDPSNLLWNSAIRNPDNPLRPGESGDVTFVAGAPGTYHYICTVPGHAALGMDGNFIIEQ